MKGVIKEVVSRKTIPFWLIVLEILCGVIFINTLITLTNYLDKEYAGVISITILVVALAFLVFIVLKFITYYNYKVIDEELIFEKIVGSKSMIVLSINFNEILRLSKYTDVEKDKDVNKTYNFVCSKEYDKFYLGEFIREGKKYRFIFKPSDRLLNVINKYQNEELSKI